MNSNKINEILLIIFQKTVATGIKEKAVDTRTITTKKTNTYQITAIKV